MSRIASAILLAAAASAPQAGERIPANPPTITSLNSPDPVFVASGDSVPIRVDAASAASLGRLVVTLNGRDVTSTLAPDGPQSLTGTVSGLQPGANLLEVFRGRIGSQPVARLNVARAQFPTTNCSSASFAGISLPGTTVQITSVAPVAATASVPEHCLISGTFDAGRVGAPSSPTAPESVYTYAIKWQVRLPTAWSGRFRMPGGGGLNGSIPNTTGGLTSGFAVAANDTGHDNAVNNDPLAAGAGSFGSDFQARVDFAYRGIDLTQQLAKGMIQAYYGQPQTYSYFEGCSMGGREAMMVTQKLPHAFDGVVVGDPAFRFSGVLSKSVYISQLFGKLAASMGFYTVNGLPLANNGYTNQDLQIVSNAILNACDALDGLVDGMVNNPMRCTTARVMPYLDVRQCTGDKAADCLTGEQIDTIRKFYEGPVTPTGQRPYHGWMWDPGIAGCTSPEDCNTPTATNISGGWRTWNLGAYQTDLSTAVNTANAYSGNRGGAAATVVVPTPPVLPSPLANEGTTAILMNYDLDQFVASTRATTPEFPVSGKDLYDVDSTDPTAFRNRGGKVLIHQPQTGGPFSPLAMVEWYKELNRNTNGSLVNYAKVQSFARLFLVPGAQHCGGGPSTSSYQALPAVVNWVENGVAPERLIGTAGMSTPWPGRTRPLCPFPAYAQYKGSGDINLAENFVCASGPAKPR